MKIGPALPHPLSARPVVRNADQSRPFADFLAESDARAAGFAELGMFGLSHAVAPLPAGFACEAQRAGDLPAPHDPVVPMPATLDPSPAGVSETLADVPLVLDDPAICALPRVAPAKQGPGSACSLPVEADGRFAPVEDTSAPEAPARAPRPRLRQPTLKAGLSLVMHEENGAVEIVARAPPMDPESRGQLRRLVEAILARSGLALVQLKLNGAPLAPDTLGQTGGRHGTRPN